MVLFELYILLLVFYSKLNIVVLICQSLLGAATNKNFILLEKKLLTVKDYINSRYRENFSENRAIQNNIRQITFKQGLMCQS